MWPGGRELELDAGQRRRLTSRDRKWARDLAQCIAVILTITIDNPEAKRLRYTMFVERTITTACRHQASAKADLEAAEVVLNGVDCKKSISRPVPYAYRVHSLLIDLCRTGLSASVISDLVTHPVCGAYGRCSVELFRATVRARDVSWMGPNRWLSIVPVHTRPRMVRDRSPELLPGSTEVTEILFPSRGRGGERG